MFLAPSLVILSIWTLISEPKSVSQCHLTLIVRIFQFIIINSTGISVKIYTTELDFYVK
jgi:hypothetical protein